MNQGLSSRETLLVSAKALFWTRGYSNVSVREIAPEAGVDVALINRYFDTILFDCFTFCATSRSR